MRCLVRTRRSRRRGADLRGDGGPHPGEVLVRVRAFGVNPGDVEKRADWMSLGEGHPCVRSDWTAFGRSRRSKTAICEQVSYDIIIDCAR